MDKEDAKKVIEILRSADGGCDYCVKDLLKLFYAKFPEHATLISENAGVVDKLPTHKKVDDPEAPETLCVVCGRECSTGVTVSCACNHHVCNHCFLHEPEETKRVMAKLHKGDAGGDTKI
jgi:hypothetical protein